jgi:hypothetical protein
MSERDSPSREFLQFPAEGSSSIRLLYVDESPELLGSWSTEVDIFMDMDEEEVSKELTILLSQLNKGDRVDMGQVVHGLSDV